jgi:hypothetical protein
MDADSCSVEDIAANILGLIKHAKSTAKSEKGFRVHFSTCCDRKLHLQ